MALQNAGIPADAVGAHVQQVDTGSPIVSVNASRPMSPASVMKLVTTFAGLELLGPAFTWKTSLVAARAPVEGVITGDLTIRGGGDPKLTIENFWLLLRALRGSGVREITGDLIVDASYFDIKPSATGAFDREPLRPYNVVPHALLVNFKAVKFHFAPPAWSGPVAVTADPRLPQVEVLHQLRASQGSCVDWREAIKPHVDDSGIAAKVTFTGTMPSACGPQDWYLSVLSHPSFIYGTFKSLWEELGGTLNGKWREETADPGASVLVSSTSPALAEIVRDINKFSNNVMARHLFLTLSAHEGSVGGSEDRSAQIVGAWMKSKGLEAPGFVIENGSGLSRNERISAQALGRLLVRAYESPIMPEFIASLPLVAVDGTMRQRLRRDNVAGHAHIKTGGLSHVSTIAGYVKAADGRRFAVTFFVNHPNAARSGSAQDALLRWVHRGADLPLPVKKNPAMPAGHLK
ncbi:MAG: D-alanyl-D-alanine carboxypeptidase/D-alanyl-D-alanine-endopeptidase [Burkholderiales bacterium]